MGVATEQPVGSDADPALRPRSAVSVGLAAGCAVLVLALPLLTTAMLGDWSYRTIQLEYPGARVALSTTVVQVGAQAGAVLSIGALVHLLFLQVGSARELAWLPERLELRMLQTTSLLWLGCATFLVLLRGLDGNGLSFADLSDPQAAIYLFEATEASAPWLINAGAALLVAAGAWYAHRWTGLLLPLFAALVGVLAPVVSGQVLVGPNHDIGSDAAAIQTVAAYPTLGAIAIAALRVGSGRLLAPAMLPRLLRLTVAGLVVMVTTEVPFILFTLAGSAPTASVTGWFLIVRAALLVSLVAVVGTGWWLGQGGLLRSRSLALLLATGLVLATAWSAVSVAMTRVPPPHYFVHSTIAEVYLGFDTPLPPTAWVLFTQWRANVLFASMAALGVGLYLYGTWRLHRRGDRWPVGRTLAWVLGWLTVVLATSSGFGRYSGPDFGVHMIGHMALNMLAPGLLVLGGPLTLALRTSSGRGGAGMHQWLTWLLHWRGLRVLYNPLLVFIGFISSYYGLYFTPLFNDYMKYHWAHQLMNVHFLLIGYLYYGLVVGVDRTPRPLPHITKLGYVLAAMPFHAFFGVILMTSKQIVAEEFYSYLDMPWADLARSQYVAGGVAWAGGEIPLMIIIVVLAVQWARQDSREGRRKDRQLDAGRDEELAAYNQMMRQLAERSAPRAAGTPGEDSP
ncbi:cytochrome c oxidase assembly protein [Ruania albidiflava]|uniref:cytochrome c oxidase assembly protein n=1 Tax=Ruania albidiflava TaxID=366586 RepID=UPI0003B537A3|nr:cytochrome c oxidase assembly protein [Ruania albidiflava]